MIISIIMPVYNGEMFLDESIGSVLAQDYKRWELICVDDGSTDQSLNILENYAKQDVRIKVFHQINRGAAQARKRAIENSKGEYIALLDSDDLLSTNFLSETLKTALEACADVTMPILIQEYKSFTVEEYSFNKIHGLIKDDIISSRTAFLRTFPWSVHGLNLYKAEHIKKYALSEISNFNNYNADEYLTRYLLLFANKIVISNGMYYYRANPASITRRFSIRRFEAIMMIERLYHLAETEKFTRQELKIISHDALQSIFILKLSILAYQNMINQKDFNYWNKILNEYAKNGNWKKSLELPSLNRSNLMKYLFTQMPEILSRILWRSYKVYKNIRTQLKLLGF